ncbi:MAG: GNAT family N-acetyltransferase [Bacteroidota bacterium]
MEIVFKKAPYLDDWQSHFKRINLEWLEEYFTVTLADLDQLENPDRILKNGGAVLFLVVSGEVVGTLALVKEPDGSMELAKMGILSTHRGKGFGRKLIMNAIEEAKGSGAYGLHLDTVDVLKPAIALYESAGFCRVGEPQVHPLFGRTTFRMELKSL